MALCHNTDYFSCCGHLLLLLSDQKTTKGNLIAIQPCTTMMTFIFCRLQNVEVEEAENFNFSKIQVAARVHDVFAII